MSRLLAFIGSTPTPTTSFEPTTLDFDDHSLNNTLISRDRPIGFFGPVRGRQYQLRVNAYRNDKGGCSWPDGIEAELTLPLPPPLAKNFMGGINLDMNGQCKGFNFKHKDLTEMISMSLPTRWYFPEVKHCEVAFYQQYYCEGLLMGFLTERDARATETNCFELLGAHSAKAVCGETWWDVWDQAGIPWLDPNSPWFLDDHDEWLLDVSGIVMGNKNFFKHCHPGDVECVLWAATTSKQLQIHDRDGEKRRVWFEKMQAKGQKLDFSKDQYRECDWNGRCGMMCPKGNGYRVLCDGDMRKMPKGEEYPYNQAWEIASPNLPGNTIGNQRPLGAEPLS
ncbi:uncharacterized protein CLAFUR5_04726 [Fulvia fulva]|uniref:Uncharacterized protein n=1 Tax=Passalora fulva TaxID=5499 RepID=A0A9Q8P7G2_PASFU|nr:uncharacterized protein CLAFUR5_04726 [Fulvia fulva]UJO16110.1 hypothetical protein CLAFUR5_04726 [Fulvia fulva]